MTASTCMHCTCIAWRFHLFQDLAKCNVKADALLGNHCAGCDCIKSTHTLSLPSQPFSLPIDFLYRLPDPHKKQSVPRAAHNMQAECSGYITFACGLRLMSNQQQSKGHTQASDSPKSTLPDVVRATRVILMLFAWPAAATRVTVV